MYYFNPVLCIVCQYLLPSCSLIGPILCKKEAVILAFKPLLQMIRTVYELRN